MKVNLKRLEKMAAQPEKDWTASDYRMAHYHLTYHLGWELTKWSISYWDWVPIANERNHKLLNYINPRTNGCYDARGAIKYLVETMNNVPPSFNGRTSGSEPED